MPNNTKKEELEGQEAQPQENLSAYGKTAIEGQVDKNKEEHIHKYEYINIGGKSIIGCLECSSLKPKKRKEPCGTYQMTARCMCGKGCGEFSPQSPLMDEDYTKVIKCGKCGQMRLPEESCDCFPSSNEDWEKQVRDMFIVGNMRFSGLANDKLTPDNLVDFIRQQRLEAQREEKERIIDWCKKRMEHNKIQYGTDKWNGDMEDLVELLSGNKE